MHQIIILINFFSQAIVSRFLKFIFFFFIKLEISGLDNLKLQKRNSYIFASNHLSEFDSLLIRILFPTFSKYTPLITVGRIHTEYKWKGWRKILYSKWIFRFLGCYAAQTGYKNYSKSLGFFVKMGKLNQSILIFIGGLQKNPDNCIKPKGGAGYLALETGLPIVPVTIHGTYKLIRNYKIFKRTKVVIHLAEPYNKNELIPKYKANKNIYLEASKKVIKEIEKNYKFIENKQTNSN